MRRHQRLLGLVDLRLLVVVATGALVGLPAAALAVGSSEGSGKVIPHAASSWKRCGNIKAPPSGRFRVSKKGKVTCHGAKKLMRLFLVEGQGVKHGGPSQADTYWTLYGWTCGTGTGGGGCKRHGGRDRTSAEWVP